MNKENAICARDEERPVRITRARAKVLGSVAGISPSSRPPFSDAADGGDVDISREDAEAASWQCYGSHGDFRQPSFTGDFKEELSADGIFNYEVG